MSISPISSANFSFTPLDLSGAIGTNNGAGSSLAGLSQSYVDVSNSLIGFSNTFTQASVAQSLAFGLGKQLRDAAKQIG